MNWRCRVQFFAIASRLVRCILVDNARATIPRSVGGGAIHLSLDEAEMRYLGGMSVEEIAEVLKVSEVTVMREWRAAKALLHSIIKKGVTGAEV